MRVTDLAALDGFLAGVFAVLLALSLRRRWRLRKLWRAHKTQRARWEARQEERRSQGRRP
jgi:C4-dicarboxylate-specific signal transduction histidine kinase